MRKTIEVEAATTQEAIELALQTLGVPRERVSVKVLCEEHRGLFGMKGAKPAKVRVTIKDGTLPVR